MPPDTPIAEGHGRTVMLCCVRLLLCVGLLPVVLGQPSALGQTREAMPWREYRGGIENALESVEQASEDGSVTEDEVESVAIEVDTFVPARETVAVDGGEVVVDNSVVRGLTTALRAAGTEGERERRLEELRIHLVSLEKATTASRADASYDAEALARSAQRVIPQQNSAIEDLLTRFLEWLAELLEPEATQPAEDGFSFSRLVTWALVIALALLLTYALVVTVVRARGAIDRSRKVKEKALEAPVSAAEDMPFEFDVLVHADELAERGLRREALRTLFGAAARTAADVGWVRQMRTRTNTELVRQIRAAAPEAHPKARALALAFELAWYGHVDPGDEGYHQAKRDYKAFMRLADAARDDAA